MRARPCPLVLAILVLSCGRPPPDATPDGAARLFLDAMEAAEDDAREMRRAYDLLGPTARANLEERARRTSRLQGRQVHPWDMLAAGRFGVAFRPKTMHAKVVGDRASVEVLGADPQTQRATIVCVQRGGGWRVEPEFPDP
jgi:uncharacterized protein YbjT (DUF2867 family)